MDRLTRTLPAILKASGDSPEVVEAACTAAWKHVVGEGLATHAIPVRLQGQALVVAVADAIWQKQLESMCAQLLFKLNSALGQSIVKSIDLRVDPLAIELERAKRQSAGIVCDPDYRIPAELLTAAAGIADANLRRAFLAAATSCVRRLENPQSEI